MQLLSEGQQNYFFEQLLRESAQVSYASQNSNHLRHDHNLNARLNIKLVSSVCQKYDLDSCEFELILVKADAQEKLFSWYRPYDGLVFSISADQQKSLTKL